MSFGRSVSRALAVVGVVALTALAVSPAHAQDMATISGTVVTDQGVPLPYAYVQVQNNGSGVGNTTADAQGAFSLSVPAGDLRLLAYEYAWSSSAFETASSKAGLFYVVTQYVSVGASGLTKDIVIPTTTETVRVVDEAGNLVAGAYGEMYCDTPWPTYIDTGSGYPLAAVHSYYGQGGGGSLGLQTGAATVIASTGQQCVAKIGAPGRATFASPLLDVGSNTESTVQFGRSLTISGARNSAQSYVSFTTVNTSVNYPVVNYQSGGTANTYVALVPPGPTTAHIDDYQFRTPTNQWNLSASAPLGDLQADTTFDATVATHGLSVQVVGLDGQQIDISSGYVNCQAGPSALVDTSWSNASLSAAVGISAGGNTFQVMDGMSCNFYNLQLANGQNVSTGYLPIDAAVGNILTLAQGLNFGVASPPAAVEIASAKPGDHSATVTWLKPASSLPITGYTVTATPGGQTCTTDSADVLTCTIFGLANDTSYTFTVTANSAAGPSPEPITTPQPIIPAPVPDPVTGIGAVHVGDGTEATITWLAAASDPYYPVIGYTATAQPGGHYCTTSGALSCTITGLTPGQDYAFTVTAINGIGASDPGSGVVLPGDTTPPVVHGTPDRLPNSNGWYNAPVVVHWTASDPDNPAASLSTTPDTVVSTEGVNETITSGQVCDPSGNCASGQSTLSIDTTGPTVTISGVAEGSKYVMSAPPNPTCQATDTLSGVAGTCLITIVGGNANHVGAFTATATATDRAGNTTTTITHYKVIYGWNGFDQPINDTAHQTGLTTSVFKAGSTVPAQFTLTDGAGHVVQPVSAPVWLTPVQGVATTLPVDESVYTDPADSGSTYRAAGSQWKFNWATSKAQAGYYWRVGVRLDDGETYYVNIALR